MWGGRFYRRSVLALHLTSSLDVGGWRVSRTTEGQYRCNWCKANLTLKETSQQHISLEIGSRSGLAADDSGLPGWRIKNGLPAGQYHFCVPDPLDVDLSCVDKWLRAVLVEGVGDAL